MSRFRLNVRAVNISTVDPWGAATRDVTEQADEAADGSRDIDERGLGPAALAAIGSIALALYYYYVRGDKQRGQFIGLWPGTILGVATYARMNEILRALRSDED